jgi:hypothetical protein
MPLALDKRGVIFSCDLLHSVRWDWYYTLRVYVFSFAHIFELCPCSHVPWHFIPFLCLTELLGLRWWTAGHC